ncbi:hypothetical protein JHD48_07875 [Sulfurimonas sp. SAG-AH-194-I05]|nr:hypothetical protein [Sulfurimonas sp. SAG-AH-194-I05]MDF1875649.1 hypothetical protein [Sulfurimonas sp. SAG-AH-194-I05]
MNQLLEIFPFINQIKLELENQNKFLNKVTLTGKINALKEAENLFEFTDKTVGIFNELKIELIDALLLRNINKFKNELNFKSSTCIDILIRNLFERTADVGFLATDSLIKDFLLFDTISLDSMKEHLNEYIQKYSVYNEIVVFDAHGKVMVNINKENILSSSNDSIITQALQTNDYIEVYKHTNIFKKQNKTLMYAQKITYNNNAIGVLVLCFKFEDELHNLFSKLANNGEKISLSDNDGVLFSNFKVVKKINYSEDDYKIIDHKYISVMNKAKPYQEYTGITSWFSTVESAQIKPHVTQNTNATIEEKSTINRYRNRQKESSSLLDAPLVEIIDKANDLIEDIADVIINGELIASKQRVYVLTPILDNLRNISVSLLQTIKNSLLNLEEVVKDGLVHDAKMASRLSIDIMDRNLYERANDCRWWALTPLFKDELSQESPNTKVLEDTLKYINNLYTVYTNIILYDANQKIIASSNNQQNIANTIDGLYIEQTLKNKNTQNYFVSDFKNTSLYENKATYIYSATVASQTKNAGIAVVFDAYPEFKAILQDSFPKARQGFSLFCNAKKEIIASTCESLKEFDTIEIDDAFFSQNMQTEYTDFITYNHKKYIVGSALSQGYREYKKNDNYSNKVYAITFIEV